VVTLLSYRRKEGESSDQRPPRNTPAKRMPEVAAMLKAIHASEDKKAVLEKAEAVYVKLEAMKLKEAAKKIQDSIAETLTYCQR